MEKVKTSVPHAAGEMYKNLKMGESAILDLMPKVTDEGLREDMLKQLEGYRRFADDAKELLDCEHREAKEAGVFAKMGSKMGIAMNTMMDSTSSHIAEMIIEGSTMGITDQTRILHELEDVDKDEPHYDAAVDLAKQIISFEQKNIEVMKTYL